MNYRIILINKFTFCFVKVLPFDAHRCHMGAAERQSARMSKITNDVGVKGLIIYSGADVSIVSQV